MSWDTSCRDWQERIKSGRTLMPVLPLTASEADRGEAIFRRLQLPDVTGRPLMADAAGQWMFDLVRALFGGYDPKTNERMLRELFVLCPKKSSKTTLGAAIMITAVLMSRRPRAEFLIVAPTQEVSDLAFRQAVGMIEADPVLAAKFHIQEHIKKATYRPTGAFLKVKSFDPKIVTGSKPAGVLLDELHVIAEAHDADRVIGQLRGGLISQPEAFMVTITTQSERPPAGVFRAELLKARAVRDGITTGVPMLPLLYEFPPGVDWRDPANWHMVTPNNGRSITVERLVPDYHGAVAAGEGELRRWASQHLNVEIGLALRSDAWIGADFWERNTTPGITLDHLLAVSDAVTVGIDGGGMDDLLGLAVIGRHADTGQWLAWTRAYCHPIALERRKADASRMHDFARDGDLVLVAEVGDDVRAVADVVEQCDASGLLDKVGVDPIGIGQVLDELAEREIDPARIIGISQGYRLGGSIKTVERKLAEGALRHGGQPLMAWCVGNARIETRANSILVTKAASGSGKIDPIMALFNAAELMSRNPGPSEGRLDDFIFGAIST
jgi:phage terminase large subunit-like protein